MIGVKFGQVQIVPSPENVIIIGSGKSLECFDFERLKGLGYIIAVNDSVNSIPFADAWFTLDPWGLNGPQLPENFKGKMFAAVPDDYATPHAKCSQHRVTPKPHITFLHRLHSHNLTNVSSESAYKLGLSEDNSCISTGNSGYGALNLAYHMKPNKILLLGIDGTLGYFYKTNKCNRPLTHLNVMFESAKPQLGDWGIQVINGSKESIIDSWERYSIDDALHVFSSGVVIKKSIEYNYTEPTYVEYEEPAKDQPITVAMVFRTGGDYDYKYVNALAKAIRTHTTIPCNIVCLTDFSRNIKIDDNHLTGIIPFKHRFPKWWGKIELFRPDLFVGHKVIFFDLDTIIKDNIDFMLTENYKFAGLRDFNPSNVNNLQSGVMAWIGGSEQTNNIYTTFIKNPNAIMNNFVNEGDAKWIRHNIKEYEFLQDKFPDKIVSFKKHLLDTKNNVMRPTDAPIICFHGKPRPHTVKFPVVVENWKP